MGAATLDLSTLGAVRRTEEFRVNTARLGQYAAAIGDTNAAHLAGAIAPAVFAAVPATQATIEALQGVTKAPFIVHGEHDIRVHRPIAPGMRLVSRARAIGAHATRAGVSIIVKSETETIEGEPVDEQYLTGLVPGLALDRSAGATAPDHKAPDEVTGRAPVAEARYPMPPDQTRRYAEASRDYSAYTLDLEAARAEGYDGLLVHGLCTLAFAGRAVVAALCGDDSRRLKRLACRFTNPVLLKDGQAITTRLWAMDRLGGHATFAFECLDAAGSKVIRHGLAEVSP